LKNKSLKIVVGVAVVLIAVFAIRLVISDGRVGHFHDSGVDVIDTPRALPQQSTRREPYGMRSTEEILPEEKTPEELRLELREKIVQKRREADALEARKRKAFSRWWHPPRWCNEASTMKMLVQCGELRRVKREEFDKLLAAGRLAMPPAK